MGNLQLPKRMFAIILYVTQPYKRVNLLISQHHFAVASISLMRFSWLTLEALAS